MKKTLILALMVLPFILLNAISQVQPNDTDGNGRINISTLDHLRWVSENSSCWGQDFELDNDINAWDTRNWNNGVGWSPIGNATIPFTGDFDGNEYAISGISFNNTRVWDREFNLGFFGRIQNCIIENLKINSCSFYSESNESLSNHYIGALAGSAINCTITNLSSSGSINGKLSAANSTIYIGGIVGHASNSDISFTTSSIYLTGFCNVRVIIGGLVGYNSGLYINYCSSSIIIKSGSEFGAFSRPNNVTIGGLVGINELGSLKFCHSYINNIESYGDWNAFVGGLVGKNNDSILNCYVIINKLLSDAAASIPTVASAYAGGIAASNGGYISKCYSIINQIDAIAHDRLAAPEYEYLGTIVGSNSSSGIIEDCIYNIEKSGNAILGIGSDASNQTVLARNTAEMKTDTTYMNHGWDFATVWAIDSTQNDGYPSFIKIDNNAVCKLEISYPNSTNTALYKDFVLDIKTNKGDIYKRNTSLNPSYTISGFSVKDTCTIHLLNKYNDTLGIINNVPIQEGINSTQFANLLMPYTVRLNANDQKGNTLNNNISVKWFDASNKLLVAADSIKNIIAGKKLKYLIEPNRNFKHSLAFPDTLEYIVQNGVNNITIRLDSLQLVSISGTIRDAKDSSTIKKATVSISQTIGVQNSENQLVKTDSNGVFSANIYTGSANISVSYNGYLNKSISIDTITTNRILGNIYLSEINGATLDLSMSYIYASKPGDSLLKNDYYSNWQDLDFEIFNITKNKVIKDYQLQFPTFVILDTNTAIRDSIRITAINRKNEFKSKSGATRLDSNLYAIIQLDFIQNGSVKLSYSSTGNDNDVALVYDANGKLVKQYNYSKNGYVQTDALPEGTYKIVSMGYSDFFNDIQDIDDLSASGLVVNTDYLLNQVTVSEGTIAEQSVGEIPFFNESKLYYTGDKTLFSSTKTKAVLGSYFTLKTRLNFKSEYSNKVSNLKLIYNLPENCPIIEESVMIGRRTDVGYSKNNDIITIPLPINFNDSNEVRFCVLPTEVGIYKPNAYVQFDMDGKTIKQPLGIVSLEVSNLNIGLPNKTAQKSITALGIVFPNSEVILFDNGVEVGRTKSFANGGWRLNFDLVEPYSYSYHDIYAQINTPLEITLRTQNQTLTYDDSWIEVSKVTMINTAHGPHSLDLFDYETVFDFLTPSTKPSVYWYWPSYPDFTFKIDFTQNDPERVTDVVVNTITAKGKEFPLKATYDQTAKCWIATGRFDSYNLPVNVSVGYDGDNEMKRLINLENGGELLNNYNERYVQIPDSLIYEMTSEKKGADSIIVKCPTDSTFYYSYNMEKINEDELSKILANNNPWISKTPNGHELYSFFQIDNDEILIMTINTENMLKTSMRYPIDSLSESSKKIEQVSELFQLPENDSNEYYQARGLLDILQNIKETCSEINKLSRIYFGDNSIIRQFLKKKGVLKLLGKIPSGDALKVMYYGADIYDASRVQVKLQNRISGGCLSDTQKNDLTFVLTAWSATYPMVKLSESSLFDVIKITEVSNKIFRKIKTNDYIYNKILKNSQDQFLFGWLNTLVNNMYQPFFEVPQGIERLIALYEWENCQIDNSLTGGIRIGETFIPSPEKNATPVQDPSGYVYEAVSSNLLPGVTTTCYYKTQKEDMYGDMQEVIKLWDAENYEQQNPLTTDENGFYAWDVPQGQWQVKYEKDGYDTEYSDWLPVPPPQLDVNQGMTSAIAPEVKSAIGYESKIKAEFTKYMKIDSLNSNNITLTNKKDSLLKGTIILTNQEAAPGNTGVTYASKFNYVPENALAVGDTVFLKINSEVKSYANIPMDNDYQQMIIIKAEPKTIEAPEVINLASNGKISVTVKVTPANAAAGQKLKAKSGSNALVSITPNEITLNSTGTAQFEVSAHLAGTTYLTFALDESELRAETKVNIGMPTPKLTMPKASIDSGTTVRAGTELVLTSREFDSKIYYTLDGTSPVTSSSRILYNNPINMNTNTVVKAYNFKDGFTNSDIAVFGYKVINVYNITTTVNPDSAGTVTGAGEYYENQKVELILKKNKDFVFKNWTIDNQEVSTDTIYTFNATKNCNVVANFVGAVNSTSLLSPINNAYRITVKPEFTWQLVQEAEHYELQIAEDPYFVHKIIDTNILTTKYLIPNDLLKNTSYFWKVRVWSKNNSSSWSPTWSFTTEDPADVKESKSIFSISPQPVRDEAIITFNLNNINSGISIELYDIKGTQTAEYKFTSLNEGSNKLRLDLSNIPSGMYNVIIKIGANIHRTKLMKIE